MCLSKYKMVDKVKRKSSLSTIFIFLQGLYFFHKDSLFSPFKQRDKNLHKSFVLCTEGLILCILFG